MGNKAMECFGRIELTLPNGREVVGKVPTLKQQIEVMDLIDRIARGKGRARLRLIDWFPKLVGLEDELNQLTFEEFFDVINRFFGRRGLGNGQARDQEAITPTEMASGVCSPNTPPTTAPEPPPTCTGRSS